MKRERSPRSSLQGIKWYASVVTAIVVLSLLGCTVRYRDAVSGTAVQQKIDESIGQTLRSYDGRLNVQPSKCDPIVIEDQGTMGWCSLTVDGVPLKIRVAGAAPPDHFGVDFGGASFFEMPQVDKLAENFLFQHFHATTVVNCGEPGVRLLHPGTYLNCSVSGAPGVKSIKLKAMPDGHIFIYNPRGLKDASPVPVALLTLHEHGRTSIARGSEVEAFISSGTALDPRRSHYTVAVKCPASIDLTGKRQGVCVISYLDLRLRQRIRVWIEDGPGLKALPVDAIVDRQKLQRDAQSELNKRLADNGDTPDAKVICQRGFLVIPWPGTFACKATAGGKRYKLLVFVHDAQGTSSWRGVAEP